MSSGSPDESSDFQQRFTATAVTVALKLHGYGVAPVRGTFFDRSPKIESHTLLSTSFCGYIYAYVSTARLETLLVLKIQKITNDMQVPSYCS
jgi:hypothetical protein